MNLATIDLNLLLVFDALARECHVSRAARRLEMSQPAVSHALRRLRELFGDELFVRAGASMVPTPRAQQLATPIAAALATLERALTTERTFEPARERRTFRVAASDLPHALLLPALVRRLTREAPGIELLTVPPPEDPAPLLAEGRLDLAVSRYYAAPPGCFRQKILHQKFVAVLRKDHPAAKPGALTPETLTGLAHLVVEPVGMLHKRPNDALAAMGMPDRVTLTIPYFLAAPFILAESDLVWLAPQALAALAAEMMPLACRPIPFDFPGFDIYQCWHERSHLDPGHVWFRELVAEVAAGVSATPRAEPERGEAPA